MTQVWVVLVHHPVLDRAGEVITTAVTNLDVHDIARSARTYDLAGYYVITPIEAQRRLVDRILTHWRDGSGARRVPERTEALSRCSIVDSVEDAIAAIETQTGRRPVVVSTSARSSDAIVSYAEISRHFQAGPGLLLLGTGHGLAPAVIDQSDYVLAPIEPGASYNHLSVRAAAAIMMDRLFGTYD